MALENVQRVQDRPEPAERTGRIREVRNLAVWERCTPVRVAGCEDDPAEPHIVRGID